MQNNIPKLPNDIIINILILKKRAEEEERRIKEEHQKKLRIVFGQLEEQSILERGWCHYDRDNCLILSEEWDYYRYYAIYEDEKREREYLNYAFS